MSNGVATTPFTVWAATAPSTTAATLEFCARHRILPRVEHFPMSRVNEAIEHLRSGKTRYCIVLDAGK